MMFKTHIAVSLVMALLVLPVLGLAKGSFVLVFLAGSVIPDIDSRGRLGSRPANWALGHRGFLHSLTAAALFSLPLFAFRPGYGLAFLLGFLSHLLADSMTVEGVRLFYPLKSRIRGPVRTNSAAERILFVAALVTGFALLLR